MVFIHTTVGKNQNIGTVFVCFIHFHKQTIDCTFQFRTLIIGNRNNCYLESRFVHLFDLQHIRIGQDRIVDL